jgi:hypothetical protein
MTFEVSDKCLEDPDVSNKNKRKERRMKGNKRKYQNVLLFP